MIDHVTEPWIECWMRDGSVPGLNAWLDGVTSRLYDLAEAGCVAEVNVNVCGRRIRCPPRAEADGRDQIDDVWTAYREFESWAASNDRSLAPAFRRHTLSPIATDEECEVVEFPLVCLAVYDGDNLEAVFPCATDERTWTVEDGLERLESLGLDAPPDGQERGRTRGREKGIEG